MTGLDRDVSEFVGVTMDDAEGFVCRDCGFAAETREAFDVRGLAMACPECGATHVEHYFPRRKP